MLDKQLILGVYDDGDKLLSSVKKLRQKGVDVFDCYTPYPVHHLDTEMGIKRSNLTVGAFICGMMGTFSGLLLQFYMMTNHLNTFKSWPMIIGGKPQDYGMLPSMIPVIFELTILFTAFGIGILFFARSGMIHGKIADIVDPRQTDDRMLLAVEPSELSKISRAELDGIMNDNGALEIRERNMGGVDASASETIEEEEEVVEAPVMDETALLDIIGTATEADKDDLKQLNGLGPAYEAKLNGIGIYTFAQISKLTAETITIVEEMTKASSGKIEKEDWVNQAKNLLNG